MHDIFHLIVSPVPNDHGIVSKRIRRFSRKARKLQKTCRSKVNNLPDSDSSSVAFHSAPQGEILSLTGLRGLAAIVVMLFHANIAFGSQMLLHAGNAVDLFFVLSGYVMSVAYLKDGRGVDWRHFAAARFARIYPLHLLTGAAMISLGLIPALLKGHPLPESFSLLGFLHEVTLSDALPVVGANLAWNPPSWSISIEWWIYFTLFPVIALWGHLANLRAMSIVVAVSLVATTIWLYVGPEFPTFGWIAACRGAVGFAAGWHVRQLVKAGEWILPHWVSNALLAFVLSSIYLAPLLTGYESFYCLPLMPVLVYTLVTRRSTAERLLSKSAMVWLGRISYSIYLVHPIVVHLLLTGKNQIRGVAMASNDMLPWIILTVVITIGLSALSFRFIERPARDILRRLLERRLHFQTA